MAKVQRSKISVVDCRGKIVVTFTAKFDWNPETGDGILPDLKSKVKEACNGLCDLPNVFHLSFIDKEGDPVALLNYGDLCYVFQPSNPDEKRPRRLYVFLPPGPRQQMDMKTGQVVPSVLMASKDDDLKLDGIKEELMKVIREASDLLGDVREELEQLQMIRILREDSSSEILEPIMK